jgi:pyruvate-formate lyase-activating enzyme
MVLNDAVVSAFNEELIAGRAVCVLRRMSRDIAQIDVFQAGFETKGYALTPQNLDRLQASDVDAFWLDIKAHDAGKHRWLTGCSNEHILRLPEEILKRGFTLEVLSLYIPSLVESDSVMVQIIGVVLNLDCLKNERLPTQALKIRNTPILTSRRNLGHIWLLRRQ